MVIDIHMVFFVGKYPIKDHYSTGAAECQGMGKTCGVDRPPKQ